MVRHSPILCALVVVAGALPVQVNAQERMVIHVDDVRRRTCPSTECGVVGGFFLGESVPVYETMNGWSRVSGYYSAGRHDGRSAFVETGPVACTEANGIAQGEFAEWVRSEFLAREVKGEGS
jgi:hypothetical protein